MKIKDKYFDIKYGNMQSIVIIKVGTFYVTFKEDAEIIKRLLSYKVENGKLGFPASALDKVLSVLDEKKIDYYILDNDDIIEKHFDENGYDEMYKINKKMEYKESLKKILIDRIEFLLDQDEANFEKIRKFLEEL